MERRWALWSALSIVLMIAPLGLASNCTIFLSRLGQQIGAFLPWSSKSDVRYKQLLCFFCDNITEVVRHSFSRIGLVVLFASSLSVLLDW